MKEDTIIRIRKALIRSNLSLVARKTGLSTRQVRNIRDGVTANPRWDTMLKLARCLEVPE